MLAKLSKEDYLFTDNQIHWLLENIGNESSIIRDEIVFTALASGLLEGTLTKNQFDYIKNITIKDNLIFYHMDECLPATLTRSFTALLNGFIIQVDGDKTSPYYHQLSDTERSYFFNSAIVYLKKETDRTGYSQKYGWVHAFAHGGDYLSKVMGHDLFPKDKGEEVLSALLSVIKNTQIPFLDEEEKRLANAIYIGIKTDNLSIQLLMKWVKSLQFPLEKNADFYQLAMFKSMLAYIYFHGLDSSFVTVELKEVLLECLKEY